MFGTHVGTLIPMARTVPVLVPAEVINHKSMVPEPE